VEQWINDLFTGHGAAILYGLTVVILMLAGLGLPIPEEAIFLAAGFAGSQMDPKADVWILCAAGLIGIMLGDSLPFWLGRHYGLSLLKKWPFCKVLSEKNVGRTQDFFNKHGSKTVFVARFVAGLRMPTFFLAGAMGVKYRVFFLYDLIGALISCPTSIWLAYTYGEVVRKWIADSHVVLYIVIGLVVLYTIYHVMSHRPEKKMNDSAPIVPVPTRGENAIASLRLPAKDVAD